MLRKLINLASKDLTLPNIIRRYLNNQKYILELIRYYINNKVIIA